MTQCGLTLKKNTASNQALCETANRHANYPSERTRVWAQCSNRAQVINYVCQGVRTIGNTHCWGHTSKCVLLRPTANQRIPFSSSDGGRVPVIVSRCRLSAVDQREQLEDPSFLESHYVSYTACNNKHVIVESDKQIQPSGNGQIPSEITVEAAQRRREA